jgi:hypothetical protein
MAKSDQMFSIGREDFKVEIIVNPTKFIKEYGPRFDNTAYVNDIYIGSKNFLKPADGLIDEFGIEGVGVLNYKDARAGQKFIKIGVGALIRDTNEAYAFNRKYPLDELWPCYSEQAGNELKITQISREFHGYAYKYCKTYDVDANKKQLSIKYELTNFGKRAFDFEQYNHNWFYFASQPIGPDYYLSTDFDIAPDGSLTNWLESKTRKLLITKLIVRASYFSATVHSPRQTNHCVIANKACMQSVEVGGDFDICRFALYCQPDAICPEVFMKGGLESNQCRTWKRTYVFRTE